MSSHVPTAEVGRGTRLHLFAQAIQQWVQNGGVQNLIMQVLFSFLMYQ